MKTEDLLRKKLERADRLIGLLAFTLEQETEVDLSDFLPGCDLAYAEEEADKIREYNEEDSAEPCPGYSAEDRDHALAEDAYEADRELRYR